MECERQGGMWLKPHWSALLVTVALIYWNPNAALLLLVIVGRHLFEIGLCGQHHQQQPSSRRSLSPHKIYDSQPKSNDWLTDVFAADVFIDLPSGGPKDKAIYKSLKIKPTAVYWLRNISPRFGQVRSVSQTKNIVNTTCAKRVFV